MTPRAVSLLLAALLLGGCFGESEGQRSAQPTDTRTTRGSLAAQPSTAEKPCPVTRPNGRRPPGENSYAGSRFLGNGALWTDLYPNPNRPRPDDVRKDGSIVIKVPWWRGVRGRLTIEGRRLDTSAPSLTAWVPDGYGPKGFQSSAIIFPTPGCWEVTGRVGDASLTFVTLISEPA
jgi:hypothetical protein